MNRVAVARELVDIARVLSGERNLTAAEMKEICPACAEKMERLAAGATPYKHELRELGAQIKEVEKILDNGPQSVRNTALNDWSNARYHYRQGKYDEAAAYLDKAIRKMERMGIDAIAESTVMAAIKEASQRQAEKWEDMPKGWTDESRQSFWDSLTGDRVHKISACMKQMEGKVSDPGKFCGALASRVGYR